LTSEGLMLLHMGRADVALPGLEDALHLLAEWNHKHPELSRVGADLHRGLAEAKLAAGDPAGAWTYARQALTYALESNLALCIGKANCALGDVITALPAIPETDREQFEADPDAYYSAALAALHAINADAEIAHTLFAQGMSLAARDHKLRAAHALQQAMISYTRLEMSADAARAAQAQLDITM
jgi:tetratricopeptide (TPR) repeat protein